MLRGHQIGPPVVNIHRLDFGQYDLSWGDFKMDSIGLEATSATSGDVHGLSLPAVIGMLILVLILGLLSRRQILNRGLSVQNLFLKVNVKRGGHLIHGFLRALDMDGVNLVMNEEPKKGEEIELDLASLPGFPSDESLARAIVLKVKSVSNHHKNYIVQAKFVASQDVADDVNAYLKQLLA